jgi:hypothetical protein
MFQRLHWSGLQHPKCASSIKSAINNSPCTGPGLSLVSTNLFNIVTSALCEEHIELSKKLLTFHYMHTYMLFQSSTKDY